MVRASGLYLQSDLDGQDPGGFVVVNVDAPVPYPYQVLGEDGGYYQTLEEAREACQRFREEGDNADIYVYALIAVSEAIGRRPEAFTLA